MNNRLAEILYLSVAAAAITLTITRGSIFQRPRKWLRKKLPTLGALMSCPYCLTHWICLCFANALDYTLSTTIVTAFVMVGISTIFMGIIWFCWGLTEYRKSEINDETNEALKYGEGFGAELLEEYKVRFGKQPDWILRGLELIRKAKGRQNGT